MIVIKQGSTGAIDVVTRIDGTATDLTSVQAKIYDADKTTVEVTYTIADTELSKTAIGTYQIIVDTSATGLDLNSGRYYVELSGIYNTKTYLDREAFEVRFV
jgi:hypothetical protein